MTLHEEAVSLGISITRNAAYSLDCCATAKELLEYLQSLIAKYPNQDGEVRHEVEYGEVTATFQTPKTDLELQAEIAVQKRHDAIVNANERALYERLKAKFDSKP